MRKVFNYLNAGVSEVDIPCDRWSSLKILRQDGLLPVYSKKQRNKNYKLADPLA